MKLIKPLLIGLTAMVVAAGFAVSAQATLISGMLNIAGTATYDKPIATATEVKLFSNVTTQGANTGDFSAILAGVPVAMTSPYIFNPSSAAPMLWSVAGFTFDLANSTIIFQSVNGLLIEGNGTISGNGFDPTPGKWSFSQQSGHGTRLSFSATTEAVPDDGMTATLLGLGLAGVVGAARLRQRA
jgi:hypothetical protein